MRVVEPKKLAVLSCNRFTLWSLLLRLNLLAMCLLMLSIPVALPENDLRTCIAPSVEVLQDNKNYIRAAAMEGQDDGQVNVLILKPDDVPLPPSRYCKWVSLNRNEFEPASDQLSATHSILHTAFVLYQPVLVISIGDMQLWKGLGLNTMPYNFQRLWIHYDSEEDFPDESTLTDLFLARQEQSKSEVPLISVFTTTYKSGHKLERAYQSLLSQTYDHWEWILWDDSPEDDNNVTFETLKAMAARDMRLQVYKAPRQSGNIGRMKFRAASLASGEWLIELDHDDRLGEQLFEWVNEISQRRPGTKFIYSDHVELYEENEEPFTYGQYYGLFHGSYLRQHLRSHKNAPLQPHYISRAPWANPLTLQHLTGLPNHVRIWNMSFYQAIGRHNSALMVADDYELLLKTYLSAQPGEIVCIASPSYFQYRNNGGNNFTFKRNALIQHMVWHLRMKWQKLLSERYDALGWSDAAYIQPTRGVWEEVTANTTVLRLEHYFVPEDQDADNPCVSIVITTYKGIGSLVRILRSVVTQTYTNWKIFIIGDGCPKLDAFATQNLTTIFPRALEKIYWYNLDKCHQDDGLTAQNYALKMLIKTRIVLCLDKEQSLLQWGEDPTYLQHLVRESEEEGRIVGCKPRLL